MTESTSAALNNASSFVCPSVKVSGRSTKVTRKTPVLLLVNSRWVSDFHEGASLELDARLPSECLNECFGGYFCLPQDASKRADLDFRMHGNYAALAAASQNDVTSALTNPYKSESL